MRRPLLAGNWKMYKTVKEAVALSQEIRAGLALPLQDRDVLVAPPNTGSYDKNQADARYLTQFGINAELADWLPEYAEALGANRVEVLAGDIAEAYAPRRLHQARRDRAGAARPR